MLNGYLACGRSLFCLCLLVVLSEFCCTIWCLVVLIYGWCYWFKGLLVFGVVFAFQFGLFAFWGVIYICVVR